MIPGATCCRAGPTTVLPANGNGSALWIMTKRGSERKKTGPVALSVLVRPTYRNGTYKEEN
jgi:hypothetical protein